MPTKTIEKSSKKMHFVALKPADFNIILILCMSGGYTITYIRGVRTIPKTAGPHEASNSCNRGPHAV